MTLRLDSLNDPQPDAVLRLPPEYGGSAWVDAEEVLNGGPELVADASPFPGADRTIKSRVYRRFGVREYIDWRVEDGCIDWFVLRGTQYEPLQPDANGLLKSVVFPGLWLDPTALVAADMARVLVVLQRGLASAEHAAFVARVRQASTP